MGFRKALYDVEEKGLDPIKPHKELGPDGRLASTLSNPSLPVVSEVHLEKSALVTGESVDVHSTETIKEQSKEVLTSSLQDLISKKTKSDELPNTLKELSDVKENQKPKKDSGNGVGTKNNAKKPSTKVTNVDKKPQSTRRRKATQEEKT